MKIERRKLSYSQQRNQVVTTINPDFLREIAIEPDSQVNIIYDDTNNVVVMCSDQNLDHILDLRVKVDMLLKDCICPTCGSINIDKNCKKCNKTY